MLAKNKRAGKPEISRIPSFILKSINSLEIRKEYHAAAFAKITAPPSNIKIADEVIPILAAKYGTSPFDPTFSLKTRNNQTIIMHSTNCRQWEYAKTNGGKLEGSKKNTCDWCKCSLAGTNYLPAPFHTTFIYYSPRKEDEKREEKEQNEEKGERKKEIMGEKKGEGEEKGDRKEKGGEKEKQKAKHYIVVHGQGKFHSFNCCFSHIDLWKHKYPTEFTRAERNLKFLFELVYPGKRLIPAPHPWLHEDNGGSISKKAYDANLYTFVKLPNVILLPMKSEYIQQEQEKEK